jgi:hypothetical protein
LLFFSCAGSLFQWKEWKSCKNFELIFRGRKLIAGRFIRHFRTFARQHLIEPLPLCPKVLKLFHSHGQLFKFILMLLWAVWGESLNFHIYPHATLCLFSISPSGVIFIFCVNKIFTLKIKFSLFNLFLKKKKIQSFKLLIVCECRKLREIFAFVWVCRRRERKLRLCWFLSQFRQILSSTCFSVYFSLFFIS